MNKNEFLSALKARLSALPPNELEERLEFYSEMLDDRIEEGLSEEAAVAEIGSVDDVAAQITSDIPFVKLVKEKIKPKHSFKTWEIICLILGSPIWVSLLIALAAVIFSAYAVFFAVLAALWAVELSLAVSSVVCIVSGIVYLFGSTTLTGLVALCTGAVALGVSILAFFGCKKASKGIFKLTKNIVFNIKKRFVNKENKK